LRDLGLLKFDEPALRYFTNGIVHGSDGEKMSKSRPETLVEPFEMINKYGADTLRLALVSFASPDKDTNWDEKVVLGSHKFLNKVFDFFSAVKFGKADKKIESKLNRIIKETTEDIENFKHNLAVIKIRQLFDAISESKIDKKTAENFLKMLHIYCPYITEELWEKIGNNPFISLEEWPISDEKKIDKKLEEQEEAIESLVGDINNILRIVGTKKMIFIYTIPNEKQIYSDAVSLIKKKTNLDATVYAVNDKEKYDPENKSKKAKLGKPAIFLE
jgi:leucyl-tRNA synthetase